LDQLDLHDPTDQSVLKSRWNSGAVPMTIWVNEQIDPAGITYACIASRTEEQAKACYESFQENLTDHQRSEGWVVTMRTVESWDDVPVAALKLSV
jgi:hypothetical protein